MVEDEAGSVMLSFIRAWFAWKPIRNSGAWVYLENTVTGQRKAVWLHGGYQPLNHDWLRTGDIVDGPEGRYVIGSDNQ